MNFLKHQSGSCVAVNGGTERSQISSKISYEQYGGGVIINDKIFIFG